MSRLKFIAIILVIALTVPMALSFFRSDEESDDRGTVSIPNSSGGSSVELEEGIVYSSVVDLSSVYAFSGEEDSYMSFPTEYITDGSRIVAFSYKIEFYEDVDVGSDLCGLLTPQLDNYRQSFFAQVYENSLLVTNILYINQFGALEILMCDHKNIGEYFGYDTQIGFIDFYELYFASEEGTVSHTSVESGELFVTIYETSSFSLDDVKAIEASRFD